MVYFFCREGAVLQCEIRLDADGIGYELVIEGPDSVRVERFDEPESLNRRWSELERSLLSEGWAEPEMGRA